MDIKTQLKLLLTLKHISMKQLAELMSNELSKTYTPLNRKFYECQCIAKILGYEIEFKEIK